jgi:hypothetical protein
MSDSETYTQSFGIVLHPTTTDDGEWTGDVEVNIAFTDNVLKSEEDELIMMNVLQMMASSLELMESDEHVAQQLVDIVERRLAEQNAALAHGDFGDSDDGKEVSIAKALDGDDNIIHLSFVKAIGTA